MQLPSDVFKLIFDEIHYLHDAVFLCLTHESLGPSGERRVYELVLRDLTSWRGHRIACIGDHTDDRLYPPQLQPYVNEWIQSPIGQALTSRDRQTFRGYHVPLTQAFAASLRRDRVGRGSAHVRTQLEKRINEAKLALAAHAKAAVLLERTRTVETTGFRAGGRALCNLSKGEFIREDAIRALHARHVAPRWQAHSAITLGQALVSMICWASSTSCGMKDHANCERLTQGPWAGDRFEVVPEDQMRAGVAWRDFTDGVVSFLTQLWIDNHDPN